MSCGWWVRGRGLALGLAISAALACGKRPSPPPPAAEAPRPPAKAVASAASAPVPANLPDEKAAAAERLRVLRAEASRRCHAGSAQISLAGELGSRCTVDRGCVEGRGKVSASDGNLTLECRGLSCTCAFEPRRDRANRKRIQFAIDRPCGLSRGARAESLWLEHCYPLLPPSNGAAPAQ